MVDMLIKLADDINSKKELQAKTKTVLNFRIIKHKCKNNLGIWEGKG